MVKSFLNPLIPQPIKVETEFVKGNLDVEGNLEHNYIRFRFRFNDPLETSPLIIIILAQGKEYKHNCLHCNYEKNEVETEVFRPDFSIFSQFSIENIEPMAKPSSFLTSDK